MPRSFHIFAGVADEHITHGRLFPSFIAAAPSCSELDLKIVRASPVDGGAVADQAFGGEEVGAPVHAVDRDQAVVSEVEAREGAGGGVAAQEEVVVGVPRPAIWSLRSYWSDQNQGTSA